MEKYYQLALIPHIVAGFLALVVAPVAMIVKKGGKAHRLWGKIFFYSITMVAITALVMSAWTNNVFMAMVAVFSFYLAASGYRSLYRKKVNGVKDVAFIDWLLLFVSGLFSIAMILVGAWLLEPIAASHSDTFQWYSA